MNNYVLLLVPITFLVSCGQPNGDSLPVEKAEKQDDKKRSSEYSDSRFSGISFKEEQKDQLKSKLLKDFDKPLRSYPKIKSSMATYAKDGLLYRKGIVAPFSGRLFDESEDGVILLEVAFLEGKPHGAHIRRNRQNNITMEAFFDHGVLTGVKTKWWSNGLVNEEEYWDEGSYKGKKVWDETGRLLKDERVD